MNAETFFKKLDEIRSEARQKFGMKHESINFLSESVQNLIKLVDAIHDEEITPKQQVKQAQISPPLTIEQLKEQGLYLETTKSIETDHPIEPTPAKPEGAMTLEKLPRDPKPVHPVEVVEATKDTVVAPDGGWHDGDS